jgi:hypothetical protein
MTYIKRKKPKNSPSKRFSFVQDVVYNFEASMPVEVLEAIKEAQGTEEELASIKAYLDSGADKEAPLGNF